MKLERRNLPYCVFKVSNKNTRTRCQKCSKLTIKTSERLAAEGKCWLGRILQKCYSSSIFSFNVSVFPKQQLALCAIQIAIVFGLYI